MRTNGRWLAAIAIVVALALWIDLPTNPGIHINLGPLKIDRDIRVQEGLDLRGGVQVTLEADVPAGTVVDPNTMQAARTIIENRINGLGVSEPQIQLQQETNRVLVELPGVKDPEEAIRSFRGTGLLEFVDTGAVSFPDGALITTSLGPPSTTAATPGATPQASPTGTATAAPPTTPTATATSAATTAAQGTVAAGSAATPGASPTAAASPTPQATQTPVFQTILTGRDLKSADAAVDEFGKPEIRFSLNAEGAPKMAEYTRASVGKYLTLTMDKRVLSSAVIQTPITEGEGRITGRFTLDEVQRIVLQLKYGALPVPLKVVENRTVGPTLGEDSVNKSIIAGTIGLLIVAFFMIGYYRFPGFIAVLVLLAYAAIVFALFKLIPVTLTLAGIAGFVLSIGMAVDANILIFERTKEELRTGKTVGAAIEAGFNRAWTSIRDSNVSTLITCAILFWFGLNFGASVIRGFAFTLAIGVFVSMFTAILVTRTVLRGLHRWFSGEPARAQRWRELWAW
ncbi:MAG: protein translocase subunit SecD [Chloroflexota bacterium]